MAEQIRDLSQILADHAEWLKDSSKGTRADLSFANFSCAKGIMSFCAGRGVAIAWKDKIKIGCIEMSANKWAKDFKKIGKREGYGTAEIVPYGNFIKQAIKWSK